MDVILNLKIEVYIPLKTLHANDSRCDVLKNQQAEEDNNSLSTVVARLPIQTFYPQRKSDGTDAERANKGANHTDLKEKCYVSSINFWSIQLLVFSVYPLDQAYSQNEVSLEKNNYKKRGGGGGVERCTKSAELFKNLGLLRALHILMISEVLSCHSF